MHHLAFPLLVGLIVLAFAFDYLNGLHDAANSIATVVGTQLMSPVAAVAFAAFFNFAAYFLALEWPSLHKVASTIGQGLIDKNLVTPAVVFGALVGAMFWNVVTWLKGLPSSSSHALVGGIIGAGLAHSGFGTIQWAGLNKTLIAIVLSPVLGLIVIISVLASRKDEAEVTTVKVDVRPELRSTVTASGEVRPVRYIKLTSEVAGRIDTPATCWHKLARAANLMHLAEKEKEAARRASAARI